MTEEAKETKETKETKTLWAECARCGGRRNCEVQGHFQDHESDEHVHWWVDWRILRCRGCEYVFIQKVAGDSESYTRDENGEIDYDEATNYWPALAKRKRPEWMSAFGIDAARVENLKD